MQKYSDFAKKHSNNTVSMDAVLGRAIAIQAWEIKLSKWESDKQYVKITFNYVEDPDHTYTVNTSSSVLLKELTQFNVDMFETIIKRKKTKNGKFCYSFS